MNELTLSQYLLGSASVSQWQAMMLLSAAMAAVMAFNRVKKRDLSSERTPVKFSIKFFISDSIARILSTLISIYLVTLVSLVWVPAKYVVVFSIFIGLISDQLPVLLTWIKSNGITAIKKRVLKILGRVEGKVDDVNDKADDIQQQVTEIKNKTDQL